MTKEPQGDINGEGTPATPPVAEQPAVSSPPASSEAPAQGGDTPVDRGAEEEPMIPKSRFDEAIAKERSLRETEMLNLKTEMETKLQAAASSLTGTEAGEIPDKDLVELSTKYGVDVAFLKDFESVYQKRADAKLAETLKPLQSQQQSVAYDREFSSLLEAHPEAASMTHEEREEFKKEAHKPSYTKTTLIDLWKIKNFGKPQGQRKTVESGRGRGAAFASDEVDIGSMSDEEFLAYGEKLANK